MPLVEPSDTILETGVPGILSRADGSQPVNLTGILEDAIAERDTGNAKRAAHRWEFTCRTDLVVGYGEGDLITVGPDEYEILDRLAEDPTLTIFLIS